MTEEDFRRLALALPGTTERRHGSLPTFVVGGRRFATLGWPRPGEVSVVLGPDEQELMLEAHPGVFERADGKWGRNGHSRLNIEAAGHDAVRAIVVMAWRRCAPASLATSFRG